MKRAAIWLCWGEKYLALAAQSARPVDIDRFLICPREDLTDSVAAHFTGTICPPDGLSRRLRGKSRVFELIPEGYDSFVYLDADTRVLGDLSLGFEKAEQHGIAVAPAPNYNLAEVFGFTSVFDEVGQRRADQMQYNAGVIFFRPSERVREVFVRWRYLCDNTGAAFKDNDQPFFSLAMEQLGFLPYVLSPAYNFRANQGALLAGGVRIWHNMAEPPTDINDFARSWPPRRFHHGQLL
jgi:hypothetical protein